MLGLRIKKRREELKLTQQELALKLGYKSRSSINKIEIGENDIPFSRLSEIAKALNTSELYLLGIGQSQDYYFKKVINKVLQSKNIDTADYDELFKSGIDLHNIDSIDLEYLSRNPELMIELCKKLGINYNKFTSFLSLYSAFGDEGFTYYENESKFLSAFNKMIENNDDNQIENQNIKNFSDSGLLAKFAVFLELTNELYSKGVLEDLNKLKPEDRDIVYSLIKRLEEKDNDQNGV